MYATVSMYLFSLMLGTHGLEQLRLHVYRSFWRYSTGIELLKPESRRRASSNSARAYQRMSQIEVCQGKAGADC